MRKRRYSRVSTSSEDEDEDDKPISKIRSNRKRRKQEEEEEEKEKEPEEEEPEEEPEEEEPAEEEEEGDDTVATPIGDPIRLSGKGRWKKKHYSSFECEGNVYELEDPVLLTPESQDDKPYVAIIKDISEGVRGLMITGQWFYRPEEAAKKGGGTWPQRDTRELFYSFHLDDVPAESVMHRCVVHFIPPNKKIPRRSQHPGFIIQKVYDVLEKKLWKLTDKDYEDGKQDEINLLVAKTMERLGELEDINSEEVHADHRDQAQLLSKWNLRRRNVAPIDTSKPSETSMKPENLNAETPGSCLNESSEFYTILAKFKALTGDLHRDKWLEKVLQGLQQACTSEEDASTDNGDKEKAAPSEQNTVASTDNGDKEKAAPSEQNTVGNNCEAASIESNKKSDAGEALSWPDSAVSATTALEKAAHETVSSQKYNQKMRQLCFNLKGNIVLARRLLKRELEPAVILTMTPTELKEGLAANERTIKEPERTEHLQMVETRCPQCSGEEVGVADIIHAGHGDRYQLECQKCYHCWYASRDDITTLTVDTPSNTGNVGTAPWATAKFEDVEKALAGAGDTSSDKPTTEVYKKSTAPYMPVLETQKSLGRSKAEDAPTI